MLSSNLWAVYKRLAVLGLLSACLLVFSSPTETAYAAACIQDCEAYEAMCYDSCMDECGATDTDCNSCMSACSAEFRSCMRHAVWCEGGGTSYSPNCQVNYGNHCPIINGQPNPDCDGGHSGYYLICNTLGGQCVSCPDHEYCQGSGGMAGCF